MGEKMDAEAMINNTDSSYYGIKVDAKTLVQP